MPSNRAVLGFGGSFADHDLVANTAFGGEVLATGTPGSASATQVLMQVSAEPATALDEQGLIDRLVGHVHVLPAREHRAEVVADLLRAPILHQPLLDSGHQCWVLELARLGSSGPQIAPFLGGMRAVGAGVVLAVTTQFPGDRARCPAQLAGDLPHAGPGQAKVGYGEAVVLAEVSA